MFGLAAFADRCRRCPIPLCVRCDMPRENWRHTPSVIFGDRPAHEFATTKGGT